jgi:hypothetical protein
MKGKGRRVRGVIRWGLKRRGNVKKFIRHKVHAQCSGAKFGQLRKGRGERPARRCDRRNGREQVVSCLTPVQICFSVAAVVALKHPRLSRPKRDRWSHAGNREGGIKGIDLIAKGNVISMGGSDLRGRQRR